MQENSDEIIRPHKGPPYNYQWMEVSNKEFFKQIGPRNVHPHIVGDHPYTSEFKTPSGKIVGKIVDYRDGGKIGKQYLIPRK